MQGHRLPTSMLFLPITALYAFFKATLTYANTTRICAANICQEGNPPSLPPSLSLSLSDQEQQGESLHAPAEGGGIPQNATRNPENPAEPQVPTD